MVNPQNGNLALKVFNFESNNHFDHIQRLNYYTLIWLKEGTGKVKSDFHEYDFENNSLFAFAPYQPFMLQSKEALNGVAIHFHPDFFCIHKHQQEVACNGILFNNIYTSVPFVTVDKTTEATFNMLVAQFFLEMQNNDIAQNELLVSYLKIFLINATRLKASQQEGYESTLIAKEPFILQNLKNYIELHFKSKHSASDYADMLNISQKALAKITKTHFNKTITDLIAERIVIEAKRELYLSNKAIKEIAFELGYDDEHYFSRFFKNNVDVSPQMYRETVGFARGVA